MYLCPVRSFLLSILVILSVESFADSLTLSLSSPLMALSEKVTALSMSLDYEGAMGAAKEIGKSDEGIGCIMESMVKISRYDDLGDTAALISAGKNLEGCKCTGLWDALRMFELGYVESETGHSVRGAMKTRSAAKMFEESNEQEARAFYAIYAYYVDKSFSWVPFKSDRRSEYLAVLDSASRQSGRFWPLFATPLIWMYYDKEDYNAGLKMSLKALSKAPGHPVLLQVKADMLYRLRRFKEAASIYESSAESYLKRTGKSIRYWCAVMNLVRIYTDMGDSSKASLHRAKLRDPEFDGLRRWMPASLMDDLDSRGLLD